MGVQHRSDSKEQREADPVILAAVAQTLGTTLTPGAVKLPNGARAEVDGISADGTVFVEVFAKQGRLRGAQFHKVARDALKLITITRDRPSATRRIVAFADHEAASCVTGKSWLAEALQAWDVEVMVAEIDETVRAGLMAAQARQVMVNPTED